MSKCKGYITNHVIFRGNPHAQLELLHASKMCFVRKSSTGGRKEAFKRGSLFLCDELDRRTCTLKVSHDIRLCLFARFKATYIQTMPAFSLQRAWTIKFTLTLTLL